MTRFSTSTASSRFMMGKDRDLLRKLAELYQRGLNSLAEALGLNYNPQCQEDVYMVLYPISEAVVEIHIFCWFDPYFELSLS